MAMLTPTPAPFEQTPRSPGSRDTVRQVKTEAYGAPVKRFFLCALTVLVAGAALGGIIALKAAIYLSRLN
jgi:hypothetical protein